MSPKEVAEVLGRSVQHVRDLIRSGRLAARKVPFKYNHQGYRYEVSKKALDKYLRENPVVETNRRRTKK